MHWQSGVQKEAAYTAYLNYSSATPLSDRIAAYESAAEIDSDDPRAAIAILDALAAENAFDENASINFLGVYNAASYSPKNPLTGELNLKAATMYLSCYRGKQDGTVSQAERMQRAHTFLASNRKMETEFEGQELSNIYDAICTYYHDYILTSPTKDLPESEIEALWSNMSRAVEMLPTLDTYDKLSLMQAVTSTVYDQRIVIQRIISEQERESLLSKIRNELKQTKPVTEILIDEKSETQKLLALVEESLYRQGED